MPGAPNGAGGGLAPRKRYPRSASGSETSTLPSSFTSAAFAQAGGAPVEKSQARVKSASDMLTSPLPFESARLKRPEAGGVEEAGTLSEMPCAQSPFATVKPGLAIVRSGAPVGRT